MNGELPKAWGEATVGEIAEDISYGFTAKASSTPIGPKLLRITDIQGGTVQWESVPYCNVPKTMSGHYALRRGDIVFARTGATTGKSFLITTCPSEAVFASYLIRIRPSRFILPEFIAHFFQSPTYWSQISNNISGSAQPNCNATKLSSLTLSVPPLAEQRRIVAKLDQLLGRVASSQNRLELIPAILKRFRQSVLAAACSGRLTANWRDEKRRDHEWPTRKLADLGDITGGITKNAQRQRLGLQVPYLRVANVYENRLELGEVLKIGVTQREFARTCLKKDDLLFVEGNGSTDQIGRVALWDGSVHPCVHQNHLIKFRSGKDVMPGYVLFQMMSPEGRTQLIDKSTSSAGLNTLSISKISDVTLAVPSLDEQQEIVRRVGTLLKLANRIEEQHQEAKRKINGLTQSLLAKAFRGDLVPQDPNDEPASVFLASIVQQQTTGPKIAHKGEIRKTVANKPLKQKR